MNAYTETDRFISMIEETIKGWQDDRDNVRVVIEGIVKAGKGYGANSLDLHGAMLIAGDIADGLEIVLLSAKRAGVTDPREIAASVARHIRDEVARDRGCYATRYFEQMEKWADDMILFASGCAERDGIDNEDVAEHITDVVRIAKEQVGRMNIGGIAVPAGWCEVKTNIGTVGVTATPAGHQGAGFKKPYARFTFELVGYGRIKKDDLAEKINRARI